MIYYNENALEKVAMLRQLMAAGHIPAGDIDTRSIKEIQADDIKKYTQCHFFAGIGLWTLAVTRAGWPADRPIWTGSCPCQPFSKAGKKEAQLDERHLWPDWSRLIRESKPAAIFGEQVDDAIANGWLDDVFYDLETEDYACASAVLPACSVTSPQERQRLYFVAYANESKRTWERPRAEKHDFALGSIPVLANPNGGDEHWWSGPLQVGWNCIQGKVTRRGREQSAKWLIKPGLPLLVNGYSNRVDIINAAGDAIVWQVAAQFIKAAM